MKIVRGSELDYIPASHEDPKLPGSLKKVIFEKENFVDGRVQMINWAKLPANKSFRLHYHQDMEEVFIIIKGRVEVEVDRERDELSAGDAILIPVAAKHTMKSVGDEDVEYIAIGISKGEGGKTIVMERPIV